MNIKKILIVSSSFYPQNFPRAFRATELVKEFARQGYEVTLLTLKNEKIHTRFENQYGVRIKDMGPLKFPPIQTFGSTRVAHVSKRILRRLLLLLFEYPDIELVYRIKKALKAESGYDLLISIAVPHPIHWGVAKAWREENPIARTWVADCGDPYMGQTLDSFNKMFYFQYFEKNFCRKADYITVPLEGAKEGYYPEFRDKIRVIPQGFNFDEIDIDHSAYRQNPVPTFAYAGGLIPGGRDPRAFLNYLVDWKKDFKFILYTKNVNLVQPYLEKSGGRIEIRDYIPREELLKTLSTMDFLVNFENRSSLMMPSKLIDYHIVGRPVLSVNNSEIDQEIIDQFLEGNYTNRLQLVDIDRYRIENVCRGFLELCGTGTYSLV